MDFSAIRASVPVNRLAARQTFRGEVYEFYPSQETHHWKERPSHLLQPLPRNVSREFENLTGRRAGRFTVIGYLGSGSKRNAARWLVRCVCGNYEVRRTRVIKKPSVHREDRCKECTHLDYLKWVSTQPT